MGKCTTAFEELRFDVRDDQLTECYVLIRAEGDCPLGVQGWHHQTFPARMSVLDILTEEIGRAVEWPLEAPRD